MKKPRTKNFSTLLASVMLAAIILSIPAPGFAQTAAETDLPAKVYLPLVTSSNQDTTPTAAALIPGQYVVVFAEEMVTAASVTATAAELATSLGGELLHTYDAALSGFAVKLPTAVITDALATLQNDARVSYVEPDRLLLLDPLEVPTTVTDTLEVSTVDAPVTAAALDTTQTDPPWGLDRVDQRNLPLNNQYNYNNTGAGVRAYIIDTGIHIAHNEFQGRASYGVDFVDGSLPADDCNGHGTHVAGTVGGRTYGVAKGVQLIAVRVFDCNDGSPYSTIIAAVNWVTKQKRANLNVPMVANMSLSGYAYTPLDNAVQNSIAAGVTYAVAASNDYGDDACSYSPARTPQALTVGATDSNDVRASFSNIGNCLDLFAPGVSVLSAWYSSNSATAYLSGTSMASPHVAGTAALYLQSNPTATPSQVANAIVSNATANVVSDPGTGSPNRLLYSQVDGPPSPTNCFPDYAYLPAILGTPGNDPALTGTNVAERMCGFTGHDVMRGEGGDDLMAGNEGQDTLYGGTGNDNMGGGKDNDYLDGGEGNDSLTGGIGDDQVYGGMGADNLYASDGNDTVGGGKDSDNVYGEAGNDQVLGGEGNDNLWGGLGKDIFAYSINQGNDTIYDFVWKTDRLRLSGVTIRSYTQQGSNCQVNLSSGATILLINVGACRKPTVAASMSATLPSINAAVQTADGTILVQGSGFAAQEIVTLALNDTIVATVQADEAGIFSHTISSTEPQAGAYTITVPAYNFTEEDGALEVRPVAAVVPVD